MTAPNLHEVSSSELVEELARRYDAIAVLGHKNLVACSALDYRTAGRTNSLMLAFLAGPTSTLVGLLRLVASDLESDYVKNARLCDDDGRPT